ncbi:MAG: glycosyltransferase [Candidatus Saganbacteria bacterium]|nr:glycosyltransferase [Candidatus Saganbacteria bacterium]
MQKTTLNICMIVKNEEVNISKTLPNLVSSCDKVIVMDTGSTDRTKDLAASLGAEVHDFTWINDFSAARNESLKYADSNWIMWTDADEYLKKEDVRKLRAHLDNTGANIIYIPINECEYDTTEVKSFYMRDKIFRNKLGIHFQRPVNEQVVFPQGIKRIEEKLADIAIYHWGGNMPADLSKKKNRSRLEILEKAASENADDPGYSYLLAKKYWQMNRTDDSLAAFDKVIFACRGKNELSHLEEDSHNSKGWIYINELKDFEKALNEGIRSIECNPENIDQYCIATRAYMELNRFEDAYNLIKKAVALPKKMHDKISNQDFFWDAMRFSQYAVCCAKQGKLDEALEFLKVYAKQDPENEHTNKILSIMERKG